MPKARNIHPVFEKLLTRDERQRRLGQRAKVIWFTGLSGSGKSTLASALERKLFETGYQAYVLDGDNIRLGINNNLGFSDSDRSENIRRIAEVSKLFVQAGMITLNCFVSPTRKIRGIARDVIGEKDFIEVYVNTSLEVCEARDVKGLYAKARSGEISDFTGVSAPFESPENPSLVMNTEDATVDECVAELYDFVVSNVRLRVES